MKFIRSKSIAQHLHGLLLQAVGVIKNKTTTTTTTTTGLTHDRPDDCTLTNQPRIHINNTDSFFSYT